MFSSRRLVFILSALGALAAAGCGSSSSDTSSSTPTTPTPTVITETFNGTVTQNSSTVFNFTVNTNGNSLLAGYTSISPATVTALGLGIGAWDASAQTCGLNQMQNDASRSGSTAITATAAAGAYCVRVYDAGNVGPGVTTSFTVQVQHY
ncbi:MAG TPA: hypothetical protein VGI12_11615 [Vicinamibacterales bacterium]|jgi:hypothetical protein